MSPLLARTGRHRQRYENSFRLVSGCIPYRLSKEEKDQIREKEDSVEVLMVSSPNRDDLVFPKGGWEDDETVVEAACREALEEAGVKGILNENPLGVWVFRSKSREDVCSLEGGCKGYMFALEVTEELETWPEQEKRDRKWVASHVGEGRQKPPGPICIETLRKNRLQLKQAKGVVDDTARSSWATELLESFGRLEDLIRKKFEQQHGMTEKLGKKVDDLSGSVDAMQRTVHSLS